MSPNLDLGGNVSNRRVFGFNRVATPRGHSKNSDLNSSSGNIFFKIFLFTRSSFLFLYASFHDQVLSKDW
ncbi:hypothetical protein QVD99_005941 [Batrachochytrium dendrobatidis]|nr:hypothetical protein O5D80_006127 [Batrachochytrium dendrobatidis]KAK5667336.1 hypothetical protein QVD99_005941 [Batrachochytrium dendrobatidis]